MTHTVLDSLPLWQLLLVGLCFVWSGFVRSGIGFGGAALSLPLMLMFVDDPLLFLPAIAVQLLFFSLLTIATRWKNVEWPFLFKLLALLAIPFALGLFGLLNLPGVLLSAMVYVITLLYGISYMLNYLFATNKRWLEGIFIFLGGYVSGVSLIGAPLIVAVSARFVQPSKARDTFFVLWIILVIFKLSTFVAAEVDMQWRLALLTFPLAAIGNFLGLRAHQRILQGDKRVFERWIGTGLVAVSVIGLLKLMSSVLQ